MDFLSDVRVCDLFSCVITSVYLWSQQQRSNLMFLRREDSSSADSICNVYLMSWNPALDHTMLMQSALIITLTLSMEVFHPLIQSAKKQQNDSKATKEAERADGSQM